MVRVLSLVLSGLIPASILIASFFTSFEPTDPEPVASGGTTELSFANVTSFDGHKVPVSVYRPAGATPEDPVPVILHSHGWAGARTKAPGAFAPYLAAGFGVVSIDMRGHGDARTTSEARVHHVDFEIQDVRAVINYTASQPWVLLDRPDDPRLGAMGGSYGGGYQLLTAAQDDRLDAIVPEITWNDLVQALVPNGAPKSAWVDLLYGGGNANARLHPTIHQGFLYLQSGNRIPDGSVPGTPDLKTQFTESSPKSYAGRIDIPTLLVQGMPDTLFNFNEAAANYALIRSTGAPVALVTHLRGHILNSQGTLPIPAPTPVGIQPPAGPMPCGSYDALAVAWFQKHLKTGKPGKVPEVCLALDDGTALTGNSYPLPGTKTRAFELPSGSIVAQGAPGPDVTFDLFTADETTIVAGIPRLSGTLQSAAPDAIVYWKLVVRDGRTGQERVADSQVTPLRTASDPGASPSFAIDLGGVAVRLHPSDSIRLVASNVDNQFAHNSERLPGAVILGALRLDLPTLREAGASGR